MGLAGEVEPHQGYYVAQDVTCAYAAWRELGQALRAPLAEAAVSAVTAARSGLDYYTGYSTTLCI